MEQTVAARPIRRTGAARASARAARRFGGRVPPHLWAGGLLLGIIAFSAVLAEVLAPYPPALIQAAHRLQPPGALHPFGTDALGRDLFSQVVHGARLALGLSLATAALAALPGTLLGLVAGFYRGWLEQALSRLMEAWLSLPGLLLAIVLVARLGASLETTVLALGVVGIPSYYRLSRSSTLAARHTAWVEAARAVGVRDDAILWRHILPSMASPLIVLTTLRLGTVLLAASGLGFIGLGAQPPQPEWGALLANGRDYMGMAWWLAVFPGLAITLTVLGFNLLGDGLRDIFAHDTRRRR